MRGLTNAFEPPQALRELASYLRELRTTFRGNLGLAAAAYNAGPGAGRGVARRAQRPPPETQASSPSSRAMPRRPGPRKRRRSRGIGRAALASRDGRALRRDRQVDDRANAPPLPDLTAPPAWGPWAVQLAGSSTEAGVLAGYERLRRKYSAVRATACRWCSTAADVRASPFIVRVSEESRQAANALCAKLIAAGGNCTVFRTPRN